MKKILLAIAIILIAVPAYPFGGWGGGGGISSSDATALIDARFSGSITDEQLLCGENTDGTNRMKSCGAKTTGFDDITTGNLISKTGTSTIGAPTAIIDAHAASTTITLYPNICPIIHNASQADSNIDNTLPAVGAGKCFVALATSVEDKYWRLTAAAANTVCLNRTCGKDYIQFDSPAVGDTFACMSDGTNWYCYDYDSSATAGDL